MSVAYVTGNVGPTGYVYKIDLSTFTVSGSPLSLGSTVVRSITLDNAGNYVYVVSDTQVQQIHLTSFTVTGTLGSLVSGRSIVIATGDTVGYVVEQTGTTTQIDLTSMTATGTVTGATSASSLKSIIFDATQSNLIISGGASSNALSEIPLPAFSSVNTVNPTRYPGPMEMDPSGTYIYSADGAYEGFAQVDPATRLVVTFLSTFPSTPRDVVVDAAGAYAYLSFGSTGAIAIIGKFAIPAVTLVGYLGSGSDCGGLDLDNTGGNAYVTDMGGLVVWKVDLGSYSVVTSLATPSSIVPVDIVVAQSPVVTMKIIGIV